MASSITVIMTTYAPEGSVGIARQRYTDVCVGSLLTNLVVPEKVRLHLADDGSFDRSYITLQMQRARVHWETPSGTSDAKRHGIGASLNLAHKQIHNGLWMYTTDDWALTEKYDITPAVKLIDDHGYDYVRLGPLHPHLQCSTQFNTDVGWWLLLHQKYGGFNFATRPFLANKRFYEYIGAFKENVDSYECEVDYSERVNRAEYVKLGCLPDVSGKMWIHVGEVNVGGVCRDFASVS